MPLAFHTWDKSELKEKIFMYVCVCVNMCMGAKGVQKRVMDPLELEVQALMSCPTWVLGIELWFSVRAASTLYHCAISSTMTSVYH